MGLKRINYEVKDYGITLSTAYAQLASVSVGLAGQARCVFEIQQSRADIGTKQPLESKFFVCDIDKDLPIHKQVYEKVKGELFAEWEDDIQEVEG